MLEIELIKPIPYNIPIKYKELIKVFNLEFKEGGYRKRQISKLQRLYEININKTLYTFIREYSEEEKELKQVRPLPINFKILKKNKNRGGIYIIIFNNDVYIGQTNNLIVRYYQHKAGYNQCDTKNMLKNGGNFELLEFEDDLEKRLLKENNYILEYIEKWYNVLNSTSVLYKGSNKIKNYNKAKMSISFNKSDFDIINKLLKEHNIEFTEHKPYKRKIKKETT